MENRSVSTTIPVYTLSIASSLSGIPVHSIRQYIDKGLIIPYKKESSRHLFSQVDILRLKNIQKLLDENGLNIAGIKALMALIPCWAIRKCSPEERETCPAYITDSFPCWDASHKGIPCKNFNCKECDVYKIVEKYPDIKSYLKELIP